MGYNPSTGIYSLPAIYLAIPGTVIIAAQHNTPLEDLATANNYARPIIAGGTGSNTAIGAANSLKVISAGGSQSFTDSEKQQARDNITSARVDVASAATTLIAAANSQYVRVTGTTDITAFDAADSGAEVSILFASSLVLTHNATSFILPGAANVTTAAGDIAVFVSEGGTNWRLTDYTFASSMPAAYAGVPDFVQGLTLANNSTNAIDIAAGTAKAGQTVVTNSGTFTKRLDANWVAGSGNGGLDTGSKATGATYRVWPLRNLSTGAFDAIFSVSTTAGGVTVPSGYEVVSPLDLDVGMIKTDGSGNIRAFSQSGSEFLLTTSQADVDDATLGATAKTYQLTSLPTGRKILAKIRPAMLDDAVAAILITSLDETDQAPNVSGGPYSIINSVAVGRGGSEMPPVRTDASAQIRARANGSSLPITQFKIYTFGWVDYQVPRIGG